MDVIKSLRATGAALQADERYIKYSLAREKNDNDAALQEIIGEFNLARIELSRSISSENKDEDKLKKTDARVSELYKKIMENENMINYTAAKAEMDALIKEMNGLLKLFIDGESPETCQYKPSCNEGGCAGCKSSCK